MRRLFIITALIVAATVTRLDAQRRIALIVDTSGSMEQNDPPRYAVQIAKILSDLVDDQDQVAIIRFPPGPSQPQAGNIFDQLREALNGRVQDCTVPPDPSLMAILTGAQRNGFKAQIDRLLQYVGATHFGSALRSAEQFLGTDRRTPRLLLMLSDAQEGFGACTDTYTAILRRIGGSGGVVSLVKLGGYARDGFAGNPAIQFREDVQDSNRLIGAVAQVYQRFLGANKVQTGQVTDDITVKIDEHVKEAFLVVAAEGTLGRLQARAGNPHVDAVDLDYRAGGQTTGLDVRPRGYRIIRLTNPAGGTYTFSTPTGTTGGWMLVEDFALSIRRMSQAAVPVGSNAMVQFEVFDQRTGQRVTDAPSLAGVSVDGTIGGNPVALTATGPGVFSVAQTFSKPGPVAIELRMRGGSIDRSVNLALEAVMNAGRLESRTPDRAEAGKPSPVRVKLTGAVPPPETLVADTGSGSIRLTDQGTAGDETAGDGIYSGVWTPDAPGQKRVRVDGGAGSSVAPLDIDVDVRAAVPPAAIPTPGPPPPETRVEPAGPPPPSPPPPPAPAGLAPNEISFGTAEPVSFGRMVMGGASDSQVRLRDGHIDKGGEIEVSTDFDKRHATLEIQMPGGWQPLSARPARLPVAAGQAMTWPVRLRIGKCPEACLPTETHNVVFSARLTDGSERKQTVPLNVEIVPEAWYQCWRRELIGAFLLLLGGIVAHGILSPSRFGRRAGVQLSPAEDLTEGFFFPFRAARGSRSGFYRDSHLYLSEDFRVSGRKNGGFVRLRADKKTIRVRPENGRMVWRQQADGTWEPLLPQQEAIVRPGSIYRNDSSSVYFDIRTR